MNTEVHDLENLWYLFNKEWAAICRLHHWRGKVIVVAKDLIP